MYLYDHSSSDKEIVGRGAGGGGLLRLPGVMSS
jgi:hypothetical protein